MKEWTSCTRWFYQTEEGVDKMPIQITLRILNLNEGKFAAPWAITIEKEKKLYSFTKRLCLSYFLHTNFSFLRKTIKRMCEWLENWTGPEATCFPIWKLENSKNDNFKSFVFNAINKFTNSQRQKRI